jgi:hypothetical protein
VDFDARPTSTAQIDGYLDLDEVLARRDSGSSVAEPADGMSS